ncbi:lipocalin-like domain-containing protein [Candidatus Bathyarchaeota archaeon]|nr:lipocalin-like domain-containing protein [Candidatus Bathyarchaeota archaeon]
MAKNNKEFVGAWRLVSVETRQEDGSLYRRGERVGYLVYSRGGFMSVAFMKGGRPVFASGDIRGGTVEEKVAAFDGYVSYSGRYKVKGDRVIHRIEVSLFPNWVGEDQERIFEFEGDRLTLSTPLQLVGGRQLSTHLIWERAG